MRMTYQYISRLLLGSFLLLSVACTKNYTIQGTASLTIFNALIGYDTLVTNYKGTEPQRWYKDANRIIYGVSANENLDDRGNTFNAFVGNQRLALFKYPDTTTKDKPVYDLNLDLEQGSMSTLFLVGPADAPDNLLVRDQPPFHAPLDSTMAFRFVNLSPGSGAVSVTIQGQSGNEADQLSYKGITGFKNYAVRKANNTYVFEFRDGGSGTLLGTYTANVQDQKVGLNITNRMRYRNFTLILYGQPGVSTGKYQQSLLLMRH